jgi:signal transduction histidine kinase
VSKIKVCKYLLGLLLAFFYPSEELSSQVLRKQLVGSYIYNFGNKITWQNKSFSEFSIVVLSQDKDIIEELTKMAKTRKIQKKPIKLTVLKEPDKTIQSAQLIFIGKDKLNHYLHVFDLVEGKEILLVSDNYENKSYVMLNLYDAQDDKLLFEINKPNILNQKLTLGDEVLLMGGTEIDIANVYLKSQHSLRDMEKKLGNLNKSIKERNSYIQEQNKQLALQKTEIETQKEITKEQLAKIEEYKTILNQQLQLIKHERSLLNAMEDSLIKNGKLLQEYKQEILHNKEILNQQETKIDSINTEIEKRNQILSTKEVIIDKQQEQMKLLVIILMFSLILIAIVLYAYRQNKKKSEQLLKQRQQIDRINGELNKYNEELRTTLEELKNMQEQLVQSEKMASLGVLSAGIAHEINNPINFVYAGINSLLRDFKDIEPIIDEISKLNPDSDDLKNRLKTIEKLKEENYFEEAYKAVPETINDIKVGADRTAEIIQGLRNFSRIDKGEMSYANIHDGIEMALLLLRNKYKNHIDIVKNYDGNLTKLLCYPGKMNQVFLNLLSNAIDAISEKGKIWITTKRNNDKAEISIKDNGYGIPKEVESKLFDPFFTTKPVGEGTGLGLSISYGIIKEHHGEIKVNSIEEDGSEFLIILPIS